jgi:hypothetical protein
MINFDSIKMQHSTNVKKKTPSTFANSTLMGYTALNTYTIAVAIVVEVVVREASGSIVVPKDTQIFVIPLHLLTIFNWSKVLCQDLY